MKALEERNLYSIPKSISHFQNKTFTSKFHKINLTAINPTKPKSKKKEFNKVIMDKVCPVDVNKWKLCFCQ